YSRSARCPAPLPSPRERPREAEVLGDDPELDLVGPLPHLQHARVPVVAGDDVLVEEAVAAPDLAGVAGVVRSGVAAHELRDRGFLREGDAGVEAAGGLVHEGAGGGDAGLHAGEGEGDVLVLTQRLVEDDAAPR